MCAARLSGARKHERTHHRPQAIQYPIVIPSCVRSRGSVCGAGFGDAPPGLDRCNFHSAGGGERGRAGVAGDPPATGRAGGSCHPTPLGPSLSPLSTLCHSSSRCHGFPGCPAVLALLWVFGGPGWWLCPLSTLPPHASYFLSSAW